MYKRRGIGMFVAGGAVQAVRQKRREAFYDTYVTSLVREGGSIGLSCTDLTEMVRRACGENNNDL